MKKKRIVIVFIFMLLLAVLLLNVKVWGVEAPELLKPADIKIDGDRVYVSDRAAIKIFRLPRMQLEKEMGREGEGPGEFKTIPTIFRGSAAIHLREKDIVVSSIGRATFFTRGGEYIKEIINPYILTEFVPFGDRYVGAGFDKNARNEYLIVNFYDQNLKRGKELLRQESFGSGASIDLVSIGIFPSIQVGSGKVFVNDSKGIIHLFDSEGNQIKTIDISHLESKYSPVKVTKERRNRYIDFAKAHHAFKRLYEQDKNRIRFPEVFPLMKDLCLSEDRLYIFTFREKDNLKECYITDLEGNLIKKVWLPVKDMNPRDLYPYTIHGEKIHQLRENLETEVWELKTIAIY